MPMPARFRLVRPGRAGRPARIDELQRIARPGAPEVSPDGRFLVHAATTLDANGERAAARLVAIEIATGRTRRLTAPERHVAEPRFSPDGSRLAFLARAAAAPDAPMQVHVLPWDGGEATCVSDLPLGAFEARFVPGRDALLVGTWVEGDDGTIEGTRERLAQRGGKPLRVHRTEGRFYRFWDRWLTDRRRARFVEIDLETNAVRDRLPGCSLWFPFLEPAGSFDIRPDGRAVLFTASDESGPEGRLRSDVYELRLDGDPAPPVRVTANEACRSFRPRYLDGGSFVYGTTTDWDFYADRPRLMRRRPDGTTSPWMTSWDRAPAGWEVTADGSLVFVAEDDGSQRLFRLAPDADTPIALTADGSVTDPCPLADGGVAFRRDDLSTPTELIVRAADGAERRLAPAEGEGLPPDLALADVFDVRFEGAHGDMVQMFVLRTPGAEHAAPLVHLIHGGPHAHFGDAWHPRWNAQAFAADGAAVALVNFHGSTGFGQAFAQGIQGAWGDMPAEDIHRATDALIAAGVADPQRVAITGGSYGGYLVAWLAATSDRFVCAVNHAGVFDLALQYASDVTFGRARNMGGDLWTDPDAVDRWNPARHTSGLTTPMLVVHGERDYRVPIDQGLLCYGILQAKGVPSRLVLFQDENHWVLQPANSRLWYDEVLGWIARFTTAEPGA